MPHSAARRGYCSAFASVLIWALVPVGTRFFVLRVDPYVFNLVRFAASGAAALPLFIYAKPWRWVAADQRLLAVCALFAVPGYNIPVALGARTVPAGELGVLIATEPVMIAALTLLLQRRPIDWRVIVGGLVAFAGVTLTAGVVDGARDLKWLSTLQVLAGALSWSCYTVMAARLNRRYGTFGVTGAILVVGTIALVALSLPMISTDTAWPDRATTGWLAAMGLSSSLLGFLLWNYAGALVPAERLGLFLYLLPLVSVVAGARFLAESLTLAVVLGGAVTILGVWLASPSRRPTPQAVSE